MNLLRNRKALGLDLGQAAVKAVLLGGNGQSATLEGARVLDCRSEGIIDEEELSRELRPWLERNGWQSQEITVGIPQYLATTQISDFSTASQRSLEDLVAFETQQLAGLSEENFIYDYHAMPAAFGRELPMLIGICRESVVNDRAAPLLANGLRLADLSIAGTALAAAYLDLRPESNRGQAAHLLLDIGVENSTVAIVGGGNLLYSSSLNCGTDRFVQILARELGISAEEAEKEKSRLTINPAAPASPGMRAAAIFESELRSVVSQWQSEEQPDTVQLGLEKICLCGGGALIKGLAPLLAQKFECSSEILSIPNREGQPDPTLVIAYGLALQGVGLSAFNISLAPPQIRSRAHRRRRFPLLAAAVLLLAAITTVAGIRDYRRLENRQANLNRNLQLVEQSEQMIPELETMVAENQLLERLLLPYVEKGNRLRTLTEIIATLGVSRAEIIGDGSNGEFNDVWIVYLADEKSFHAGKEGIGNERDRREREPRRRPPLTPFSADRREDSARTDAGDSETELMTATEIQPWQSFVAAVYTASPEEDRFAQVRRLIEALNQTELLKDVDLLPGPDTVGREDVFRPWLELSSLQNMVYRRFTLRLPIKRIQ